MMDRGEMNAVRQALAQEFFVESKTATFLDSQSLESICDTLDRIIKVSDHGGQIFTCGNGGSFAIAQHFTTELVAKFETQRSGLRAQTLGSNASTLTALANDGAFEVAFSLELAAAASEKDMLIAYSTSGQSKNILCAIATAKRIGLSVVGFCGKNADTFRRHCDISVAAPSERTAVVQQWHLTVSHALCVLLDAELSPL